jgi:hypothetical protein
VDEKDEGNNYECIFEEYIWIMHHTEEKVKMRWKMERVNAN